MAKRIEFFYDIGSPYSYLAATQIDRVAARVQAQVDWRPFLLGGVFKSAGNTMPAAVPAKGRYLLADLERWARSYRVPFRFASRFPPNTLRAMRACTFATQAGAGRELATALFRAAWVDDHDVSTDQALMAAAGAAGLAPEVVLAACEDPAIKAALKAATDEAIARGAFGAPSFFVGEELYWGNDRLDFVEAAARG